MLSRTNIVLAVLLVIQIVVGGGLALTAISAPTHPNDPLIAGFAPDAVNEITIEDDLGKSVQLARGDDGWVLPTADNFPVNGEKVETVLSKIADFKTNRLIASNPTSFDRLEVKEDNFQRKIRLAGDGLDDVIYIGSSGGVGTTYTRRSNEDNVYLTSGLSSYEIPQQVSSWIDTSYLNVTQDNVTRLVLTNTSGTYSFEKNGENWSYLELGEGEEFDSSKVSSLLRNATSVRMTQPLGLELKDEYGLDAPEVTIKVFYTEPVPEDETSAEATPDVKPADDENTVPEATPEVKPETPPIEKSYTIEIGKALENGDYVIKADNADYYVQIRSATVTTFKNVTHDSLLVKPEEETTEGG